MNRLQLLALSVLAALFSTQCYASAAQRSDLVPCGVFAQGITCVNPITEGIVDGQWIALIFHYDGTNGGPDAIDVVTVGLGGNGLQTMTLSQIKPAGQYGDRISARFRNGKLIISNAIYLPGEAHCCYTHTAVRRFGFHNKRLMVEREATVPATATATQVDSALETGSHYF